MDTIEQRKINDLLAKIKESPYQRDRLNIIYMWVKQAHINREQFFKLIEEMGRMQDEDNLKAFEA